MRFIKYFWEDIRSRRNLDIYGAIVISLTFGVLGIIGISNPNYLSSAILATLALVLMSVLQSRHEHEDVRQLLEKLEGPKHLAQLFFTDEFNPYKLKDAVRNSRKAFFWGVTLTTTMQVLDHSIEQGLKLGLEARFLLIKPKSAVIEMTAFRNWYGRESGFVSSTLQDTLKRLAIIANDTKFSGKIEVRVVNYLPPYLIIATDPDTQQGKMIVHFTTFRSPKQTRPGFELTASGDGDWYSFFVTQFEDVWKEAEQLDISQYKIGGSENLQ